MAHSVSLLFDVEDLCWPGSDDITLEVARRLSRREVRGTFFVVGEKARLFAERGRQDVIAALDEHDLASHTTNHSIHPTIAEFLAPEGWDSGILTAVEREGAGLTMLKEVFGRAPTSWGQPGGSWGPQINAAMARLNMPVVVYPPTRIDRVIDLHWYAGSLVFPKGAYLIFDADLTDEAKFEATLRRMWSLLDERIIMGTRWTGIFICHPTRLRAVEFWDGLNFAKGTHTEPANYRMPTLRSEAEYQTALANIDRLLDLLQQDQRLQLATINELSRTFRPPGEMVSIYEIDRAVAQIVSNEDIPTHFYRFSPAELLDLVARIYSDGEIFRETISRRHVGGPVTDPPSFDPGDAVAFWPDFISACRMMTQHVTDYGCLPAGLYLHGLQWSIGSFYRAAIEAWEGFRQGKPPNTIEWRPAPLYPAIGHEIAGIVQEDYEGWPIHQPDIDLNQLLMHTCFQCWTLRPAYE